MFLWFHFITKKCVWRRVDGSFSNYIFWTPNPLSMLTKTNGLPTIVLLLNVAKIVLLAGRLHVLNIVYNLHDVVIQYICIIGGADDDDTHADGRTDDEESAGLSTAMMIVIVAIILIVILVVVDLTCYFTRQEGRYTTKPSLNALNNACTLLVPSNTILTGLL